MTLPQFQQAPQGAAMKFRKSCFEGFQRLPFGAFSSFLINSTHSVIGANLEQAV